MGTADKVIDKAEKKAQFTPLKKPTVAVLRTLQYVLRKHLLPVKETGLSFAITKNLVRIDRVLEEKDKQIKELQSVHIRKDEKGNPIYYKLRQVGQQMVPEVDNEGEFVKVDKDFDGPKDTVIDAESKEWKDAQKAFEEDPVDIELHQFDSEKVKDLFKKGTLEGIDIVPLFGYIIDEKKVFA